MGEQGDVRALVEHIAKALVDEPDQVSVESAGDSTVELRVAESDLGKVIGRQGRTARSMRNVLNAVGAKQQKRFTLEIVE